MMNNSPLLKVLCASTILLVSTPISATLFDRGNGLIYDDDQDITWMEDANYAGSLMKRNEAQTYVDNLSFGGYDDWRLPSLSNADDNVDVKDYTSMRYLTINPVDHLNYSGIFGGELGHLIYGEGLDFIITPNAGQFGTIDLFDNVFGGGYWTSEDYLHTNQSYEDPAGTGATAEKPFPRVPLNDFGWLVYFGGNKGTIKTILQTGNDRAVWAVRNGDVITSHVPLPPSAWLYGIGLFGLAGAHRKTSTRG